MAEQPELARRGLKNPPDQGSISTGLPTRARSAEFAFERADPDPGTSELPRREVEEVRAKDPDGRIVVRHRTVDTLGKMLRAGTISPEMHDAARAFQADFALASLDPIRATPTLRVPGIGREPDLTVRQLDARRRVHAALQALGGINSPAGSCVWHVVGCGCSIREWAIRRGWSGRPVRQEQAQGILIAALGVLATHLGHGKAKQAR
jgi:hypothetical protein